jgi:streptogramin lyase
MLDPEQLATLRSGDVIVPDYHNGTGVVSGTGSALYYITSPAGGGSAGSATGPGGCTQIPESTFHAGLNYPFGSAVDGNDYIYVTNRGGGSISIFNAQTAGAASLVSVSPSTGIVPQYVVGSTLTNMLNQPLNIATGPEGTIWISDYGNDTITEIIGLAYPTTTPLGNAAIPTPVPYTSGSIGYRP